MSSPMHSLPGWRSLPWSAILAIYWVAMSIGTHVPSPPSVGPQGSDKVLHLGAYAGLGFLCAMTWSRRRRLSGSGYGLMFLGLAVCGALDELLQIPVGRQCEFADWVADVIGVAIGLAGFVTLRAIATLPAGLKRGSSED